MLIVRRTLNRDVNPNFQADDVRNEAVRAAHQVGSVVQSKADDVGREAMGKADKVAGSVEEKAHEARRRL